MKRGAIAIAGSAFIFSGCAEANAPPSLLDACQMAGLCDEPRPLPTAIDILCDASAGSSCNKETLAKALNGSLAFVASKPNSRVKVWTIGKEVATTVPLGEQIVPQLGHGGERARRAVRDRFITNAREHLLAASAHVFQGVPAKKSPLVESLTKVNLEADTGAPRFLIYIGDAREVSTAVGDWECHRLPSDAAFLGLLRRGHLLEPGSLAGVSVQFAFVEGAPVARGCAVSVERELRIRALWTTALKSAGATDVRLTSGPPVFTDANSLSKGESK